MASDMGMFGGPIGQSAAEQDMARLALTQAKWDETQANLQMLPVKQAQAAAQSRYLNARSGSLEQQMAMDAAIVNHLRTRGGTAQSDNVQNPAWEIAQAALKSGDYKRAQSAATAAANIDARIASADTNKERTALIAARARINHLDELARSVRGATTGNAFLSAIRSHEQNTGTPTGLIGPDGNLIEPYTPELQQRIIDLSVSERDRALMDWRTKSLNSADRERKSKQDNRSFWQDFDNQRRRSEAQSAGRTPRTGSGANSDKMSSEDVKAGADLMLSRFTGISTEEARSRGRSLIEQAKQMRILNPALTRMESLDQAFQAADRRGEFSGMTRTPPRANPDNPLDLPVSKNKNDLKIGFWYKDGTGAVRQWLGVGKGDGGWSGPRIRGKIIRSAPTESVSAGGSEDGTLEDDIDEDDALALEDE